jgi:hypothetical protein
MLSQSAKEQRNRYMAAYMREYRRKNPVKAAETYRRYWEKKAKEIRDTVQPEKGVY